MATNVNFKENPITTSLGIILIIIGVALITLPYFVDLKEPVQWYIPTGLFGVGVLFLLAPDKLVSIVVSKSDKL